MSDGEQARQVQTELEAALEAVAEQERLTVRLQGVRASVEELAGVVAGARSELAQESADVARLESFSPTRIWAGLRGSREVDLAREQAEEQAASYAVAEAEARLAQARTSYDATQAALLDLGDVAARRERALAAQERLLRATDAASATALEAIATDLGTTRSQLTEVREALVAAQAALARLDEASLMLDRARSWSTYDTFFSGGLLTDMAKYDRMDQASTLMRAADSAMRRLSAELADVGMGAVGRVEVTELGRVFDVWFDNIFSDWAVRDRILDAGERTAAATHAVRRVRETLAEKLTGLEAAEAQLADRRERLLLS